MTGKRIAYYDRTKPVQVIHQHGRGILFTAFGSGRSTVVYGVEGVQPDDVIMTRELCLVPIFPYGGRSAAA